MATSLFSAAPPPNPEVEPIIHSQLSIISSPMPQFLFYIFVAIMLGFAAAVVFLRNPVSSALSLLASFAGLAALYISLNAYFVGTLQILVYAGAVMVLFLFIIMLMDIKAEARRKINMVAVVGGAALVLGLVVQLGGVTAA